MWWLWAVAMAAPELSMGRVNVEAQARTVVRVTGMRPGEDVALFVDRDTGEEPCLRHVCLTLTSKATRVRVGQADHDGTWRAELKLPAQGGFLYVQAMTLGQDGGVSNRERLRIWSASDDADRDGLNNGDERVLGTDPWVKDTDGDRLLDGDEVHVHGTDPLSADSDGDQVWDWVEVDRNMDSTTHDSDGDGLLDAVDCYPLIPDAPDGFVRDDLVISDPSISVSDPEFDADSLQVTWQTEDGSHLWVADIESCTGEVSPRTFQGVLIDTDVVPISAAKNGPEWMYSSRGAEVVYAKQFDQPTIMRAWQRPSGWATQPIPGAHGWGPFGTLFPSDPEPMIRFKRELPDGREGWWVDARGVSQTYGEFLTPSRWSYTRKEILGRIGDADGNQQIVSFDVQTQTWHQLTDSPFRKSYTFMWAAPELGGEEVLMTTHASQGDEQTEIALYRDTDGDGHWTIHKTIPSPPGHPFVVSAEPMVHDGRSYISYLASRGARNNDSDQSQVWIAGIEAGGRFTRRVDRLPFGARAKDPEPFTTPCAAWIFYTYLDHPSGNRVIRRAATGL